MAVLSSPLSSFSFKLALDKPRNKPSTPSILFNRRPPSASLPSPTSVVVLCKTAPFAASLSILLISTPEENQKKYAEFDERFKSSPLLKKLLEKSKLNQEKNKQEIQDKYCLRGAEWGVGDCSTDGMSAEDRDSFIAMLKQKVEGKS